MTKTDLFNLVVTAAIVLMGVILTMVDKDRACKNESLRIIWSRRSVFLAGVMTFAYGFTTHDWEGTCILMVAALIPILTVNIISIQRRNHPAAARPQVLCQDIEHLAAVPVTPQWITALCAVVATVGGLPAAWIAVMHLCEIKKKLSQDSNDPRRTDSGN